MAEQSHISESEFAMWRAVFAFSFVDNSLSLEEQKLLHSYLRKVPFTKSQLAVLREDLRKPKKVTDLYKGITDSKDKKQFCLLARALAWCEGNMDRQEEEILRRVSCLKDIEESDNDPLKETRNHPDLSHYYQQYARSGVVGLLKEPSRLRIRV